MPHIAPLLQKLALNILNKYDPVKKKLVRANQAPSMTKALHKVIMRRSELETKYFKQKTNNTLKAYKNRKITTADYIKKKEENYLEI